MEKIEKRKTHKMDTELDRALCRDFPILFSDRDKSMNVSCMHWGFCCGDGWEPIIRRLSEKITIEIMKQPENRRHEFRAAQVKEKFACLRFYMECETPEMSAAISEAEKESSVTCEVCGRPGRHRNKCMWLKTLCDRCDETT